MNWSSYFADRASRYNSGKWPTWRTILFYMFISILYMFRANSCSSSGESVVSIQHLVYVTLCRWPSSMQVGKEFPDLHTNTRCNTLRPRPLPTNNTGTSSPLRILPVMDKFVTTDYWQQCIYFNTTFLHTCPKFCKRDLVPPDFNAIICIIL